MNDPRHLPLFLESFMKRELFKINNPDIFKRFQEMRRGLDSKGYTFKPFDEYQCIFVHVPKCAGVSVCTSLFGNLAGGHQTIRDYQLVFNPNDFLSYFKFTFVRNPWDRLYSAFYFLKKGGMNEVDGLWAQNHLRDCPDFDTFVSKWLHKSKLNLKSHLIPQMQYLRLSRHRGLVFNFIGCYENLNDGFLSICSALKINANLPKLNGSRPENDDYRSHFTDKTRRIVADIYSEDIGHLGYSFDRLPPQIYSGKVSNSF